jgi:hypothetical protein
MLKSTRCQRRRGIESGRDNWPRRAPLRPNVARQNARFERVKANLLGRARDRQPFEVRHSGRGDTDFCLDELITPSLLKMANYWESLKNFPPGRIVII